ncbi:MAG: type II secretion system F family protein [Gordonia sp. (in: high G+C Gram-positive bacteria)]|uniref:type II secretion system F family protein n=1 Tax=Gordonia sp. (in: high G+C Gram-positive bacteria) TaxID=84139 RepID=UPI0039E522BC
MSAGLVLIAAALVALPPPAWVLRRLDRASVVEQVSLPVVGGPFAEAAAFDLLAVSLRAGLPAPAAVSAVAASIPEPVATPLRRVADLLALGTDAAEAWQRGIGDDSGLADLAALVRRTASSGSAFASGLDELAARRRDEAKDAALERAERAGVRISGPLGLCFLPAFVCLGIVPVVIGLASTVLGQV